MRKRIKSRNRINVKRWTVFVIILFAFLYIPSFFSWVKGEHIETAIIKHGVIDDFINMDAYLIRNEELIKAPFSGKCVLNYDEGAKVPVGANITVIYKENVDKTIAKIEELEKKIIDSQREKLQNDAVFLNDIKKIDDEIEGKVEQIIDMSMSGNINDASKARQKIDELIRKKATIIGPLSTSDVYIQSLKKQLEECQQILSTKKHEILSQTAGIVSYIIDSMEEYFNKDAIYRITTKDLDKLNANNRTFKNGETVEANKVFAKVVNNVEGYLVVVMDRKRNFDLNIDDAVKIRINDVEDLKIDGEVYYISDEPDSGKKIVAIKINKGIDETASMRKVNIDLTRRETSGLKVHTSALSGFDEATSEADIFIVSHNYTVKKRVKVIYKNSTFAIIDATDDKSTNSIGAYQEYVISAQNIQERMIVRK